MPKEISEDTFTELAALIEDGLDSYEIETALSTENPYIQLITNSPFPRTRNEVLSTLTAEFTEEQNRNYTASFVDTDTQKGDIIYTILIKKKQDQVFTEKEL